MFDVGLKTTMIRMSISLFIAGLLITSCSNSNINRALPSAEVIESEDNEDVSHLEVLASLPDRDIYLYSREPEEGVTLSIGDRNYDYNWIYMTPRGILPNMQVSDYDQDGEDELAIIVYMGSGTGISLSELHLMEISDRETDSKQKSEPLEDHVFRSNSYVSQLKQVVSFTTMTRTGELSGEINIGPDTYPVDLSDLQADDYGTIIEDIIWGNIVDFSLDNNKLSAQFGVGITSENTVSPIYMGKLFADVTYMEGEFTLGNFRFEEFPEK